MLRKLRRLWVPICLGACFSIGLILLIVQFALYMEALSQHYFAEHESTEEPVHFLQDSPPLLRRNSSWISFISSEVAASHKGGDANGQIHTGERLWFMSEGHYFPIPPTPWLASKPSKQDYANLLYDNSIGSDRIIAQLMFTIDDPINYSNISSKANENSATLTPSQSQLMNAPDDEQGKMNDDGNIKTIFLSRSSSWNYDITNGRQVFIQDKCPVNACRLTKEQTERSEADVVVITDNDAFLAEKRRSDQLWVMYMLESPLNLPTFRHTGPTFNLTATYRHDSDIATPYAKWVYFDDSVRSLPQAINYATGKTKQVAWFVTNCDASNNRLPYANELAKHIEVDIYGTCGNHSCYKGDPKCFDLLSKNYKFYLSFENSNCRDYITEKFFVNALGNNVIPIVMGAHPDDYKRVAPHGSYIHVDDFPSPRELAEYLRELNEYDHLYNEYFKWKGTGEFIDTRFFCRLCAMAHYVAGTPGLKQPSTYDDVDMWWRGSYVCTSQSWKSVPDVFAGDNYPAM